MPNNLVQVKSSTPFQLFRKIYWWSAKTSAFPAHDSQQGQELPSDFCGAYSFYDAQYSDYKLIRDYPRLKKFCKTVM